MVQIRHGQEEDIKEISEVHVASVQGIEGIVYSEKELTVWEAGASSTTYSINDSETVLLVAEANNEIVGFAEASFEEAELYKLYVDPAYQNQGIATTLSDKIDTQLYSDEIELLYVEASVNAVPFYENVGYEQIGTHQKAITVDGLSIEMEMVDMEKEL
jgi:putative acetyltransferase